MKMYIILASMLSSLVNVGICQSIRLSGCSSGEHLYTPRTGKPECVPCAEGTFMHENDHNKTQCSNCLQIKDSHLEIIHSSCNKTHNTIIVCIPGYFRDTKKETCVKCESCQHTGRQCQLFNNSVCCPGKNYNVTDGVCEIFCQAGEYLSQEGCLPCEDRYFNSEQAHRSTRCKPCQEADVHQHFEVKEPCNKTHDAKVGCKTTNYFYRESVSPLISSECEICRNCSVSKMHVGRPCTGTTDTVCCENPGMTVTDSGVCEETVGESTTTASWTTAVAGSLTCGKDHYLDHGSNDTNTSCVPCGNSTYQDGVNHTETECKLCSEYTGRHIPETCQTSENGPPESSDLINIIIPITLVLIAFGVIAITFYCKRKRRRQRSAQNGQNGNDRNAQELRTMLSTENNRAPSPSSVANKESIC